MLTDNDLNRVPVCKTTMHIVEQMRDIPADSRAMLVCKALVPRKEAARLRTTLGVGDILSQVHRALGGGIYYPWRGARHAHFHHPFHIGYPSSGKLP